MLNVYLALLDDDEKQLFEQVFYTYKKQMFILAKSILVNESDSEDVVHDVFLKMATKYMNVIKSIKSESDLRNYLLKATKNTALNMCKNKKHENISLEAVEESNMNKNLNIDDFVETVCQKYDYERILKSIKSLNEKYRYVLYYHFVMELTIPQVAKSLNQSVATTKKQLVRGKKMLLSLLDVKEI